MTSLHAALGILCVAAFVLVLLWALIARVRHHAPSQTFERAALIAGALLVVQVLFGLILLTAGHRRGGLHYVYGIAALAALGLGAVLARALQRDRWVVLAWSAFVAGLLVLRALMTGYHKAV